MAQRRSQIVANRDLQLMRDNQNLLEAMVRLIGGRKPPLEVPTGEPYETGACKALYDDIALGGGEKMPNSIGPSAKWFAVIDFVAGYWQLELDEESSWLTCFRKFWVNE